MGRVEADVSGMERERAKGELEDKERLERVRQEHKMKLKIKSIMANLKAKRDLTESGRDIHAATVASTSHPTTAAPSPVPSPSLTSTPHTAPSFPSLHVVPPSAEEKQSTAASAAASIASPPPSANGRPRPTPALASPTRLEEIELQPKPGSGGQSDDYSITIMTSPPHVNTGNSAASSPHPVQPPAGTNTQQPATPYIPLTQCERLSIQCTIEDQGVGISPVNQKKLFSRFMQVHSGYPGGTGLGLAISVFLSHLMGGTMWVVSQEGKGSRFGFSFASVADPTLLAGQGVLVGADGVQVAVAADDKSAGVAQAAAPSVAPAVAAAASASTAAMNEDGSPVLPHSPDITRAITLHQPISESPPLYCFPRLPRPQLGLSILIVDDNLDLLRLTASTLSTYGCSVYCASNPVAAMTFMCTVYKLPIQPIQVEEDERRSPRDQPHELARQSSGGSSPRSKSGLSVALPSKLDVIMIDYFLQPYVKEEKKVEGDVNGTGGTDGGAASNSPLRLNGMQLARLMHKRLSQQHQRRALKSANEVYVASPITPSTYSPPNSTTSIAPVHSSPNQLRRRLVNNTSRAAPPSSRQPAIREEGSPHGESPPLSRPHSFPDKIGERGIQSVAALSSAGSASSSNNSSPLLHLDRLSMCISLSLPAFLLMVGLAEESSLASHHSPQREACLSGKLRKPLAESQLRKVLEGIQLRQKEMEDEKQRQHPKPHQPAQHHSLSLKELRSTSAPAQHVKPTSPSASDSKGRPTVAARYPLKLLYAEDNVVNQRLLTRMLSKFGYTQVAIAENGQVALDMLEEERASGRPLYELVFMDMQMPIKGGVEASTEIRQLYGEEERPFICGVTANAMESDRQKCLSVMDDYLSKPVSLTTLEQVLMKWGAKVLARERRKAGAGGGQEYKELEEKSTEAAKAAGEAAVLPSPGQLHINVSSTSSSRSPSSTPSMGSPAALLTPASSATAYSLPTVSSMGRLTSNTSNRSVAESTASTATIASSPASQLLPLTTP